MACTLSRTITINSLNNNTNTLSQKFLHNGQSIAFHKSGWADIVDNKTITSTDSTNATWLSYKSTVQTDLIQILNSGGIYNRTTRTMLVIITLNVTIKATLSPASGRGEIGSRLFYRNKDDSDYNLGKYLGGTWFGGPATSIQLTIPYEIPASGSIGIGLAKMSTVVSSASTGTSGWLRIQPLALG